MLFSTNLQYFCFIFFHIWGPGIAMLCAFYIAELYDFNILAQ